MKRINRFDLCDFGKFGKECKKAETKSFLFLGIVKITACMGYPDNDNCASCGALFFNIDFEPKEIKK